MTNEPEKPEDEGLPPSILRALGLSSMERDSLPPVVVPDNPDDDELEMRKIQYRMLQKMEQDYDEQREMAQNTQHPRAYEVVNQSSKNIMEATQAPLTTTEKSRKNKGLLLTKEGTQIGSIHNNIIVADSADMFSAIKSVVKDSNKTIENE